MYFIRKYEFSGPNLQAVPGQRADTDTAPSMSPGGIPCVLRRLGGWAVIAWVLGATVHLRAQLSVQAVLSDNGLPARSVQWIDAAGQVRTAIMVDQRPQGAGYLRQLTYPVNGVSRICRGTGANGHQGDGYVQNHTAFGGDNSSHTTAGTTTLMLAGNHHAIISYDLPTYQIEGQSVPTTVQWFYADGRSHPIFALSQDARATAGNLGADSRSPYGDVAYDGGADAAVGGASFGDTYKFVTLAANPEQVTKSSGWRYNEPNRIPYAMQWTDPAQVDAEMGHVATLPISVQDQGSDPRTFPTVEVRGTQQLNGPMIDDENWSYQILNYVLPADHSPTSSKRLTWGSNWGRPGGFDNWGDASLNKRQYSQHATSHGALNGTRADGMLMAYSVFVVLGTHSGGYKDGAVGQMVEQMENAALANLSAAVGTVKTSGPAGVGNAASETVAYTPAGYNPVFSTWDIIASDNTVDATLTPAAGHSLDHPILVVTGYTLDQLPANLSVGNGLATADVDYFATLDTANQRLWITVNRSAASPVNLKVIPSAVAQPPVITPIYSDQLLSGFENWSWATVDLANQAPVHSGANSIKVTAKAWEALYFHFKTPLVTGAYVGLNFWIHGGLAGGQPLQVQATVNGDAQPLVALGTAAANTWQKHSVTLADLGLSGKASFDGFWIQNASANDLSPFYVDDIELIAVAAPALTHLSVNTGQPVRTADARWFGVNTAVWDPHLNTPETVALLKEMGSQVLRYPGGSEADTYHWEAKPSDTTAFAAVVAGAGAQAVVTVNYGSGTPEEAAAWVRFGNVDHQYGFKYWEIGNENYGFWEKDDNANPQDPYTYAVRAIEYIRQMKTVDPTIKIGVPVVTGEDSPEWNLYRDHPALNPLTGQAHYGWTAVVLATFKNLGVTPDFLVYHLYPEDTEAGQPSPDNDATLLQSAAAWGDYATDLRRQITAYFGAGGENIELLCTENNSDLGLQGRQSTSLVNGLYYADSLSQLMLTEFNAFLWWDLRNGADDRGSFAPTLYGWRDYGDFGLINGLSTRHPTFYAAKLMSSFAQAGDSILRVSSDNLLLSAYAARRPDGTIELLVINKDLNNHSLEAQVALNGFTPKTAATIRSYGRPQDNAARDNGTALEQDIATTSFDGAAENFNYTFPPLSLTLFTLIPVSVSPPAPTLSMKLVASQGSLVIVSGPSQYDRQNIATDTSANDYGWVGGGATPVTYSLTIDRFPGPDYSGFQVHIVLVPNSIGSTAPDYDEPNVVMLDIQGHPDGTASAWFRYKINEPGGNAFLYGAGTLGQVDCASGPLGAWSMSFLNDTGITVTAPNGASKSFAFADTPAIQNAFGGKVTAYFGNQPNQPSQIGQSTTFSRIQISGTPRGQAVDESFPGPDLNQPPANVSWQWTKLAASPSGISVGDKVEILELSWTLPDAGFNLQFSPSLSPATWRDPGLNNIISEGASKKVLLKKQSLPNAGGGYFRLIKTP